MVSYLQVENLTKSFGDLVLFNDISFGVAEGQRIGLIAKNGSGKTTLLNILAGIEGYDDGKITYRRDLRVGYLEQSPKYPGELTVLERRMSRKKSCITGKDTDWTRSRHYRLCILYYKRKSNRLRLSL